MPAPDDDYRAQLDRAVSVVVPWLRHLVDPGQVVELRALKVQDGTRGGSTWAGTFTGDELPDLARAALDLSGNCQGVYYTLNPLKPARLTRQWPRVQKAAGGRLAHDHDVLARRWVLVDVDPVRAAGHEKGSATDAEKAATRRLADAVRGYAAGRGWPAPVLCDSGNGHHLLYRLPQDYPVVTPVSPADPVRRALAALAAEFDGPDGTVDTAVYNPARIVKFPGTLACKGEPTADRPHRRAKVLEVPGGLP